MNRLRNLVAGFVFLFGFANSLIGQVSLYSFSQSPGTYSPITGTVLGAATGNATATNLNSVVYPVTLPFIFNFNGAAYSALNVSSNGFVTFGATVPSTTNTSPINSTAAYEGTISAFGRDICSFFDVSGRTGSISWETVGVAPNREIVIQWKDFKTNNTATVTSVYSFSFQVRLQETSNIIKVVYDAGSFLVGSTAVSGTSQIGLRGLDATDFNNRLNATTLEFYNSTPGTANSSTQAFNTTSPVPGMPSAGLTYTWSPPSCWQPLAVNVNNLSSSSAVVNWSAPLNTPTAYDVFYSSSNTPPTSSTTPTYSNITGLSQTISSLTPSTNYYVWVRSSCGSSDKSVWSPALSFYTSCIAPSILGTTTGTVCINGQANLTANASSGANVKWYANAAGGNAIATGINFTTPPLTSTTSYYVSAAFGGGKNYVGPTSAISTSGYTLDAGLLFDTTSTVFINGVYVYPMGTGAGSVVIALQDGNVSPATTLQTITVNLVGSAAPYVKTYVPLNFTVPPGTNYKLMMLSRAGGVASLVRESGATWGSYPFSIPGALTITAGNLTANTPTTSYYYFYDWEVSTGCESVRQPVVAMVDTSCTLSVDDLNSKEVDFNVYPNPVSNILYLKSKQKITELEVYSTSGQRVLILKDSNITSVNMGGLTAGIYLLNITLDNQHKLAKKIIKK